MKHILVSSFLILFTIFTSFAQQANEVRTESSVAFEVENALLWEITGPEIKTPSYLFGTIHLIPAKDFAISDATKKAFDESQKVVFEINIDEAMDMGTQMSLLMSAMMTDGQTLQTLLDSADYALVKDHFSGLGLPMFMLDKIKPMFLTALVGEDFSSMDLMGGGDTTSNSGYKSYELEFTEMSKKAEKPMDGLETVEFQMSIFDSIPYKGQAEMLVETIKVGDDGSNEEMDMMTKMYKAQEINAMYDLVVSDEEGLGKYEQILLINRNKNWIPKIAEMAKEGPTFFAVGAGHLGGKLGVVNLLMQAGYSMKPIDPAK